MTIDEEIRHCWEVAEEQEELYRIYPQLSMRNINIFKIYALLLGFVVLPLALILSFLSTSKGDK